MTELKANRQYKDRVFRMIFNSREKLLELYNAMNGTDYENAEEFEIVTLENAVYLAISTGEQRTFANILLTIGCA